MYYDYYSTVSLKETYADGRYIPKRSMKIKNKRLRKRRKKVMAHQKKEVGRSEKGNNAKFTQRKRHK